MNDEPQPPPLPPPSHGAPAPPPQRPQIPSSELFPTWKQARRMLFGSVVLTVSAQIGCQVALDIGSGGGAFGEAIPVILFLLAAAGLLGTLIGIAFVLMRTLHALFVKKDESGTDNV